jgi:hypothetical protein
MSDEQIPGWAVELTRQVTILNERLPTHVEWTERNIKDHEMRIRASEATLNALGRIEIRIDDQDRRIRDTEKKLWMAYGGLSVVVLAIEIIYRVLGK